MKKLIIICSLSVIYFNINAQNVQKTMKRLPDTGQISDNTKTFGEDSDYLINAPFYSNFSAKITLDTVTGLQWQRTDGGEMTIENARIYADTLTLGGFSDWRLPSAHESFSILNLDKLNPAMDVNFFTNTSADYWWTNDVRSNDATKIWATNSGGGIGAHPKTETKSAGGTKKFHARCVRNVKTPTTITHFTDNNDGTILDNLTNLVWQKTSISDTLTWEKALQYAENLTFAGASDWRLPNIKELNSINDESTNAPSANKVFFPNIKSGRYWSSTTQKGQIQNAWYNDFQNFGITSYFAKTKGYYVICVRNNTKATSVAVVFEQFDIDVFPNPSACDFNLLLNGSISENEITNIAIFSLDGKTLFSAKQYQNKINTSDFPKGIYLLQIKTTKGILVKKLIVE